ncbi:hypothetical protein [Clostridium felsineum]|uniref:hypothetical protein n=1 Tax=Clostridium felsineum TaxID=36839 RepID=UPI00098C9266|nr:hypothetical protein [Clostridium felsineum]URZ15219.1 hypothetical protein CLFE_012370 [Clostridium felsineum DSM 794]
MALNRDDISIDVSNINSTITLLNRIVTDESNGNSKLKAAAKSVSEDLKCSSSATLVDKMNKCTTDVNSQIESLKNSIAGIKQIVGDFEEADRKIAQSEKLNTTVIYR